MEPKQANVDGKKVEKVTHSVEHVINWSHVGLGLGLIVVGWALVSVFSDEKNQTADVSNDMKTRS